MKASTEHNPRVSVKTEHMKAEAVRIYRTRVLKRKEMHAQRGLQKGSLEYAVFKGGKGNLQGQRTNCQKAIGPTNPRAHKGLGIICDPLVRKKKITEPNHCLYKDHNLVVGLNQSKDKC